MDISRGLGLWVISLTIAIVSVNGCSRGDVMCLDETVCFPPSAICDSVVHCADESDENHCSHISGAPCSGSQLRCLDTFTCIDKLTDVCNGVEDCADGLDEQQCFDPGPTSGSAPECGGTLTAPPGGTVTSPNYPDNYDADQTCEWLITVPEGSTIGLTFDSFNIEDGYDYLYIYDGDSDVATELQKLTGDLSVDITSTSNSVFLRLVSDDSTTAQGFQLSYMAVQSDPATPPGGLTTEVQLDPTTPAGERTTEVQLDPTTPAGERTTEVQLDPTTPAGGLTTEEQRLEDLTDAGQSGLTTPPGGLTTAGQPEPTAPPDDTTSTAAQKANEDSGARATTTVSGSVLVPILLTHVALAYCGMFG